MYTFEQIYAFYQERYSKETFHSRLYQLRKGTTDGLHKSRLTEGEDWQKVGRTIVYTERGKKKIDDYFRTLN